METIKEVWYGVVAADEIHAVFKDIEDANEDAERYEKAKVERVRVTIDRITSS